jgi:hypothetical protein
MSCRPLACCLGIDNHAHPSQLLAPGEKDADADALPPDAISDLTLPTPMLEGSPLLPEAWRAMFDVKASGAMSQAQSDALRRRREDLQKSKGDNYPAWVLNQSDTAVMLANRVAMGRGHTGDRFKWVPFVDMFLTYPAQASKALRLYLESAPEKVLYGSDASPWGNDIDWEETAWLGSRNGRLALALALSDMVRDGEITTERAKKIGHMALHDNAHGLYGF